MAIDSEWSGAAIQKIWLDIAGRLVLSLRGQGRSANLVISSHPEAPGIGISPAKPSKDVKPSQLISYLRAHVKGSRLGSAVCPPFERMIVFSFRGRAENLRLILLFAGADKRILVVDQNAGVKASLPHGVRNGQRCGGKKPAGNFCLQSGAQFIAPPIPLGMIFPNDATKEKINAWLIGGENLAKKIFGLGPLLAKETAFRAREGNAWDAYRWIINSYPSTGPIWRAAEALTSIELKHLNSPMTLRNDVLEASGEFMQQRLENAEKEKEEKRAAKEQRSWTVRLKRRIEKLRVEIDAIPESESLRAQADALASVLWTIKPGQTEVDLSLSRENSSSGGVKAARFRLDPALSPGENLNAVYQKLKKIEKKKSALAKRIVDSQKELELGELVHENSKGRESRQKGKLIPYARYVSSDGWSVLRGKNSKENDRLLKEAKPWDLWFHARDVPGAHVLLIKPGKDSNPSPRTIVEAAGLAALYSRAAKENSVDVMMVEAARVKKPKGASPGRVVVSGEKTVRVAPGDKGLQNFSK